MSVALKRRTKIPQSFATGRILTAHAAAREIKFPLKVGSPAVRALAARALATKKPTSRT